MLESRNKYLEALNYRKDEDTEENQEAKEGYFNAKQEYKDAFRNFDVARQDFHDKFSKIYIDNESMLMKLEYNKLKLNNLCLKYHHIYRPFKL